MSGKKQSTTITFKYDYSKGVESELINGVIATITPRNEIILNHFFEQPVLLEKQVFTTTADNTLGEEILTKRIPKEVDFSYVRQIRSSVVFRREDALAIIDVLQKQIASIDARAQETTPPEIEPNAMVAEKQKEGKA